MSGRDRHRLAQDLGPVAAAVAVVLALVLLLAIFLRSPSTTELAEDVRLDLRVPYPFLLVHGLGDTSERWRETIAHLESLGLRYGGNVQFEVPEAGTAGSTAAGQPPVPVTELASGDFFTVQMADPFQSLDDWSRQIGVGVQAVLRRTGAPRVVLVGFSAGGVAARQYLVENAENHHVARLVTISSPHLGSELALVVEVRQVCKERAKSELVFKVLNEGLSQLASWTEKDLDKPLLSELRPPERNRRLRLLNAAPHPTDVEYACVVGSSQSPGLQEWQQLRADFELILDGKFSDSELAAGMMTSFANLVRLWNDEELKGGDGAVLVDSQDLRNVEFYRERQDLVSEVLQADGVHSHILEDYDIIDDALTGPSQISTAHWVPQGGANGKRIAVEFHSSFGSICEIWIETPSGRQIHSSDIGVFRRGQEDLAIGLFLVARATPTEDLEAFLKCPGDPRGSSTSILPSSSQSRPLQATGG